MGYHRVSVDTGIRAPGSGNRDMSPQYRFEGILDRRLHRDAVGLPLPAVEVGSAVGQTHEITLRHTTFCGQSFSRYV